MHLLIQVLDLAGTAVFAVSGALAGLRRSLDLFGVLVLSFITAFGGGIMRDVLLGHTPPGALRNFAYAMTAFAAGLFTFFFVRFIERIRNVLEILDAVGLGLFTITGVTIGLNAGVPHFAAVLLGVLTAVGGGAVRDVLVGQVPSVLRENIYASACLVGAILMLGLEAVPGITRYTAGLIAAPAVTLLRLLAHWRGWRLPVRSIEPDNNEPRE